MSSDPNVQSVDPNILRTRIDRAQRFLWVQQNQLEDLLDLNDLAIYCSLILADISRFNVLIYSTRGKFFAFILSMGMGTIVFTPSIAFNASVPMFNASYKLFICGVPVASLTGEHYLVSRPYSHLDYPLTIFHSPTTRSNLTMSGGLANYELNVRINIRDSNKASHLYS